MKYVCFPVPSDSNDWINDITTSIDRTDENVLIVNANSHGSAKKKYFDKLYSERDDHELFAFLSLVNLSESYEKNEILNQFGENDGPIIFNILTNINETSERDSNKLDYHDNTPASNKIISLMNGLSDDTIKKIVYEDNYLYIGVLKVNSEIK